MGARKCCSYTARGVCIPGENNSVSGKFSFAVALTKSYQKLSQREIRTIAEMVRRAAALVAHSQCAKPEPRRCFLSSLFFPRAQVRPKPPWRVSWVRQGRQDLERVAPSTCASLNPSRLACIPFTICAHIPEQCYVTCLLCSGLFLLRFFNPH